MNTNHTIIPGTINRPMDFPGTKEQAEANRATHYFIDGRCMDCDCRPYGRIAPWPCGANVPRVIAPLR